VRDVVRALGAAAPPPERILDLGCGTGVAGAAWALEAGGRPFVEGVDQSGWAVDEARWTIAQLGLRGRPRRGDLLAAVGALGRRTAAVMAFTANELAEETRARLWPALLDAARRGARLLIVEPLARTAVPWWGRWEAEVAAAGGRSDEWRFPAALPEAVSRLASAAGLDPRERTGRSLYLSRSSPERLAPP
jgi:hypothetical protein